MVTIKTKFSHFFLIAVTALNKSFQNTKRYKFCIIYCFLRTIQKSQFVTQFENVIIILQ